jgi:type II secretory pathway component GspD/PulD (secretin)
MVLNVRDRDGSENKWSTDAAQVIPLRNARARESGRGIRAGLRGLCALSVVLTVLAGSAVAQVMAQSPYSPQRPSGREAQRPRSGQRGTTERSSTARQSGVQRQGAQRPAARTSVSRPPAGAPGQAAARRGTAQTGSAGAGRAGGAGGPGPSVAGGKVGGFAAYKEHPVKYPKIDDGGKKIVKLDADPLTINKFLQQLSLATGWSILPSPEVKGSVTGWLSNISVSDALKILEVHGFYYEMKGSIFYVMTRDEYYLREYGHMAKEEFTVKHAKITDVQTVLTNFMSENGKMVADPQTGKLVVIDTKDNLEYMKEVLESLDVKLVPATFQPKYALASDLLQFIEEMLSERGTAQADVRLNMLTVWDLPERIERVRELIAELDVDLAEETFQVKFAQPADVQGMLEGLLPAETSIIAVDDRTRKITVQGVPEAIRDARQIVEDFDKRLKQVAIHAYIMTASTQRVRELGIDWVYFEETNLKELIAAGYAPGDLGNLGFSVGSLLTGRSSIDSEHVSAVINALATDNDTEILANPRVVVTDGMTARFRNVTGEPYQEGGYGTGYGVASGENQQVNRNILPMRVQFIDVGTTLDVTPYVNEDGYVEMDIMAEDSSAEIRDITSGGLKTSVPVKTENSVSTTVLVRSGETIVIGGLRVDTASKNVDKIPFLGDIPVLGHFFKSTARQTGDKELLIFIRCEIVEEQVAAETQLLQDFERDLRKEVLDSDLQPFDLGGDQIPLIRRRGLGEGADVPPFVPRYRRRR